MSPESTAIGGEAAPEIEPFSGAGSVLLLDVANFTQLASDGLSPADLVVVVNAHLQHVSAIIVKHGGVIHQYIGDAVMAYWLESEAAENHAQLAVRAARELLAHPCPDNLPGGMRLTLDLSIGTGEMVGTHFGPIRQFQIVGAAYSVANRLAQARYLASGSLRISQFTLRMLSNPDGFEVVGSIERGQLESLQVLATAQ
jgi:adenylate cyclase